VANQIAVERAVEKTGARRAITFHSRVSRAREFSAEGTRGIRQFLPEFSAFHVNGDQKSSERKQLIRAFRDASQGLITNARCLTEGIDVPAVDMVAFIDPRHSRIDIAQATGRAMRKPHGSNKKVGYVVIPLFLDRRSGQTPEEALERSEFADIADVLNAMQEQDDDLVQIIRELREAKGRGEIFDPRRLLEKIEVLGPSIELSTLRTNICAEIADEIGVSWDEWYGRLTAYKAREGHCRVSTKYREHGFRLGQWVGVQRSNKALSSERRQRLDKLGFTWDLADEEWRIGLNYLKAYKEREGHCRVPYADVENGFRLGLWVANRRANADSLLPVRRGQLDDLGFVWDPFEADWHEGLSYLKSYKEREGHCRVLKDHTENGFKLGLWVRTRRAKAKSLTAIRRQQLNDIRFIWDVFGTDWEQGFVHLNTYKIREGNCRVPVGHVESGFNLSSWIDLQRSNKRALSAERKKRLDDLGFVWDPHATVWEDGFKHLEAYKQREGHCRVPDGTIENGFRLGQWVSVQRTYVGTLTEERQKRLDELGFVRDPFAARWEEAFCHLKAYKEREKHCGVPHNHVEGSYRLGRWVTKQRKRGKALTVERKGRLDELGFVWSAREAAWEEGFGHLKAYKEREGHCRVPKDYQKGGFRLGQWVGLQRTHENLLDERRRRLDELDFVWDSLAADWEKRFGQLKAYKEREGHCHVPDEHVEGDFQLGTWVGTQRRTQKSARMSKDRKERLDGLGFAWDPHETAWQEGLRYLTLYKKREGHCLVPQAHSESGFCLGRWVADKRRNKDGLSVERQQELEKLGFVWKVHRRNDRRR
jgi:Helicase associated domain/Helicase conserved C-terminal domain